MYFVSCAAGADKALSTKRGVQATPLPPAALLARFERVFLQIRLGRKPKTVIQPTPLGGINADRPASPEDRENAKERIHEPKAGIVANRKTSSPSFGPSFPSFAFSFLRALVILFAEQVGPRRISKSPLLPGPTLSPLPASISSYAGRIANQAACGDRRPAYNSNKRRRVAAHSRDDRAIQPARRGRKTPFSLGFESMRQWL